MTASLSPCTTCSRPPSAAASSGATRRKAPRSGSPCCASDRRQGMDHSFCPGSKLLRQPAPELFPCPNCGTEVEIWTDELKGICPSCKKAVFRDGGMSCLDWCKYGKECVGDAAYKSYMRDKAVGVK